ncbi:tyrosine-protein phosphatase [Pediococcus siamensis]|uniref:tyrosine-protein phosphatase n=1 Tax=Pediococcus siamensis TaxID=381829 RepID=UPI0039A04674
MEKRRILPIQSGLNFRELGGYPTFDGRTIKWQKLLRSGYLSVLTKADQGYLVNYGLRYDVDLRSDYEINRNPDPLMPPVQRIRASVYPFSQHQGLGVFSWLKRLVHKSAPAPSVLSDPYELMVLDEHAQGAFKKLFQVLLKNDQPNQSVLFHCAAGKDRTGTAAFLVLSALGVSQETIEEDYLLSNQVLFGTQAPIATPSTNNAALDRMNEARNVSLRSLRLAKQAIETSYGSMTAYFHQAMNLSDQDIGTLKQLYTEKSAKK